MAPGTPRSSAKQDLDNDQLTQILVVLGELKIQAAGNKAASEESLRLLKGSNGEEGVLSRLRVLTLKVDSSIQATESKFNNRLDSLEAKIKELGLEERKCGIEAVMAALYGDPKDPNKTGALDDIRELKGWQKNLRYWYIMLAGLVVVGIVNAILGLVTNPTLVHTLFHLSQTPVP